MGQNPSKRMFAAFLIITIERWLPDLSSEISVVDVMHSAIQLLGLSAVSLLVVLTYLCACDMTSANGQTVSGTA
jgi:hypothetical protein